MVARVFSRIFSSARKVVANIGIFLLIWLGMGVALASALVGAVGTKVVVDHLHDPVTEATTNLVVSWILFAAVASTTVIFIMTVWSDRPRWRK